MRVLSLVFVLTLLHLLSSVAPNLNKSNPAEVLTLKQPFERMSEHQPSAFQTSSLPQCSQSQSAPRTHRDTKYKHTHTILKMLSHQVVKISVARSPRAWIWCLLEGNTHWSQLEVYVCVWTVGSLTIFALSPAISSIHVLIPSVIRCVRVDPPLHLLSLLFIRSLFCRLSCLFNILLLPPSLPPCSQRRVRKSNFPTRSLLVFYLVTSLSIHLSQLQVK